MHATLLLALTRAALVTVTPTAEDACPSSAQVQAALEKHAPRLLASRLDEDPARQLVLNLSSSSATLEVGLSLVDGKGRLRLYRSLPAPPPDRPRDCAALADTVAFIVDRYFDEVQMPPLPEKRPPVTALPPGPGPPVPPPSPPPTAPTAPAATPAPPSPPPAAASQPTAAKSETKPATETKPSSEARTGSETTTRPAKEIAPDRATVATRTGATHAKPPAPFFTLSGLFGRRIPGAAQDLGGIEFKAALGGRIRSFGEGGWPLWAELAGGIVGIANNPYPSGTGSATAIRSGVDLAVLLGKSMGQGRLYAGPIVSAEFVWLEATSNNRLAHEIRTGFGAGLRLGYQYFLRNHLFFRVDVNGCAAILRQKVVARSSMDSPVFEAPPFYATFAVGAGMWF